MASGLFWAIVLPLLLVAQPIHGQEPQSFTLAEILGLDPLPEDEEKEDFPTHFVDKGDFYPVMDFYYDSNFGSIVPKFNEIGVQLEFGTAREGEDDHLLSVRPYARGGPYAPNFGRQAIYVRLEIGIRADHEYYKFNQDRIMETLESNPYYRDIRNSITEAGLSKATREQINNWAVQLGDSSGDQAVIGEIGQKPMYTTHRGEYGGHTVSPNLTERFNSTTRGWSGRVTFAGEDGWLVRFSLYESKVADYDTISNSARLAFAEDVEEVDHLGIAMLVQTPRTHKGYQVSLNGGVRGGMWSVNGAADFSFGPLHQTLLAGGQVYTGDFDASNRENNKFASASYELGMFTRGRDGWGVWGRGSVYANADLLFAPDIQDLDGYELLVGGGYRDRTGRVQWHLGVEGRVINEWDSSAYDQAILGAGVRVY